MANALYPKWREAILQAAANSSLAGTVKVAIVDAGVYSYNAAHEFYSSLSGVVGTPQALTSKTYVNGVFDAADVVVPSVSGATAEALVLYVDTGTAGTSRLVAYIDSGYTGLPVTPNGGNIEIQWGSGGIFAFGS